MSSSRYSTVFFTRRNFWRPSALDSRRLEKKDEGPGAAIENRYFRGIHIDVQIVDPQARKRRHQVLDGADLGATLLQPRAHTGVDHRVGVGGKIDWRVEIDTTKDDSGVGRGGTQHQIDLAATMQSHPVVVTMDFSVRWRIILDALEKTPEF